MREKESINIKHAFPYLCGENPEILILGTMPGDESIRQAEYYANLRNAFWKILHNIFASNAETPQSYHQKCNLLKDNHIALWDVYQTAERKGSLDRDIKNGKVNDIGSFLKNNPTIKKVLFNGKEACKVYRKHFDEVNNIRYETLSSSSPANTISFEEKLKKWKEIILD